MRQSNSIKNGKCSMEIDAQNYAKLREKGRAVKVSLRKTEESDNKKLQIKEDWSKLISKASTTDEKL